MNEPDYKTQYEDCATALLDAQDRLRTLACGYTFALHYDYMVDLILQLKVHEAQFALELWVIDAFPDLFNVEPQVSEPVRQCIWEWYNRLVPDK